MTNLNLLTVEHWIEIKYEKSLLLQTNVLQKELLCCLKHLQGKKRTEEHGPIAETKMIVQGQPSEISDKNKKISSNGLYEADS